MEELEKEFVPHDRALRMKAIGFDEPCFGVFELIMVEDTIPKFRYNYDSEGKWFNHNKVKDEYDDHDWYWSAPTFSAAFRWFREKHALEIVRISPLHIVTYYLAKNNKAIENHHGKTLFITGDSVEEAELACLDKLLEIVESKSE